MQRLVQDGKLDSLDLIVCHPQRACPRSRHTDDSAGIALSSHGSDDRIDG